MSRTRSRDHALDHPVDLVLDPFGARQPAAGENRLAAARQAACDGATGPCDIAKITESRRPGATEIRAWRLGSTGCRRFSSSATTSRRGAAVSSRSCTRSPAGCRPGRWWSTRRRGKVPPAFDANQPFPVIRHPTSLMLPVPSVARRAAAGSCGSTSCDTVLFGAAAPLGLLAPSLRRAGARRAVAETHGHEAGWAVLPGGARPAAPDRRRRLDVVTYLGEYFRERLARALSPDASGADGAARARRGHRGVPPGRGGDVVREGHGLCDRPVVVCVSRLVPRKGQDTLIRALPRVLPLAGCRTRPVCCWSAVDRTGGSSRPWPSGPGWPSTWCSPARCPRPSCPPTTGPATCSRCRAVPAAAAWTWRGSASSTWRPPRPGCRWWPATRAARRTPSWTARPATWWRPGRRGGRAPDHRAAGRPGGRGRAGGEGRGLGRPGMALGAGRRAALADPRGLSRGRRRRPVGSVGRALALSRLGVDRVDSSAYSFVTRFLLTFSDGVRSPLASVKSRAGSGSSGSTRRGRPPGWRRRRPPGSRRAAPGSSRRSAASAGRLPCCCLPDSDRLLVDGDQARR